MATAQDTHTALIVGSTGIVGGNLAAHLVDRGWRVYGLARKPSTADGIIPIAADLRDETSVRNALAGVSPTHVFLCTWLRQPTEAENVRVNGGMTRHLFAALENAKSITHAALVTGTKQYLGPFESYGQTAAETPFREDTPRLPGENFYYTQEDILFAAAERGGFSWSVHRPHSIVGYALGNAMNMGVTLAVYAAICRETGRAFQYPGSREQWEAVTDVTDAQLLADQLVWAATTPAAADHALNIVNGDVFRWRRLWPRLAAALEVEPLGYDGEPAPLELQMADAAEVWPQIVRKHGLRDLDVGKLASWWHTDADLGRTIETFTDMGRSRRLGFAGVRDTESSFTNLFARLRDERIVP